MRPPCPKTQWATRCNVTNPLTLPQLHAICAICAINPLNLHSPPGPCTVCAMWLLQGSRSTDSSPAPCYMCYMCHMDRSLAYYTHSISNMYQICIVWHVIFFPRVQNNTAHVAHIPGGPLCRVPIFLYIPGPKTGLTLLSQHSHRPPRLTDFGRNLLCAFGSEHHGRRYLFCCNLELSASGCTNLTGTDAQAGAHKNPQTHNKHTHRHTQTQKHTHTHTHTHATHTHTHHLEVCLGPNHSLPARQ